MDFSTRLKIALELRNKTPTELADGCHINKGTISKYLNGKMIPKQSQILKIADYLDVLPTYLMGLDENMCVYTTKQLVALNEKENEELILKKQLISEIQSICSYEEIDNLKIILNVVKTLARHNK